MFSLANTYWLAVGFIGSLIGIHWSLAASAVAAMLVAAVLLISP